MGPLPALGQWVKLAVPASLVNLEGKILNGMAFTLVDGQATWDSAGKTTTGSSNAPPTVNLTAPATINLTASATDADGTITQVEFFQGTSLLHTDSNGADGYSYMWNNVPQGSYTLTAKATDNLSATTTSAPINVTVNPTPAPVAQLYYVYPDHLGTPRVITDTTNQTRWRWDNTDPFGANLPNDDPDQDGVKFVYNLRFPGQYFDQETGLFYNYFRDYDPAIGRYVESDPIGLRGGINTYSYVENNPANKNDPLGLMGNCGIAGGPCYPPDPSLGICGSTAFQRLFIIDGQFGAACAKHDKCYDTCGKAKHTCDMEFFEDLDEACKRLPPSTVSRSWCGSRMLNFWLAVGKYGQDAYDQAQKKCPKCGK